MIMFSSVNCKCTPGDYIGFCVTVFHLFKAQCSPQEYSSLLSDDELSSFYCMLHSPTHRSTKHKHKLHSYCPRIRQEFTGSRNSTIKRFVLF